METKVCTKCGEVKSIDQYYKKLAGFDSCRGSCKKCDYLESSERESRTRNWPASRFRELKKSAVKRGIAVTIALEQYTQIIKKRICFYCGTDFSGDWGSATNRIDNSEGYTLENILPCCKICNIMMNNFSIAEVELRAPPLAEKMKSAKKHRDKLTKQKGDPIK